MPGCPDARMDECTNARMHECTNARMHECTNARECTRMRAAMLPVLRPASGYGEQARRTAPAPYRNGMATTGAMVLAPVVATGHGCVPASGAITHHAPRWR